MARVKDPVCGMMVDPETAAVRVTHNSRDFHFCSEECRRAFQNDPEIYSSREHEEPYTTKGGMTAPKFGSAGSGGLEHEPIIEPKDRP